MVHCSSLGSLGSLGALCSLGFLGTMSLGLISALGSLGLFGSLSPLDLFGSFRLLSSLGSLPYSASHWMNIRPMKVQTLYSIRQLNILIIRLVGGYVFPKIVYGTDIRTLY